jgi:hypothetical protein
MGANFSFQSLVIKGVLFLLAFCVFPASGAENLKEAAPLFAWNLLWTGSWYNSIKSPDGELPPGEDFFSGGTLYNRGDFILGLPRLDLSLRFLATDKRLLPFVEDDPKAGFNPGFGIYHRGSGSRFLYGVQSEHGLPSRINHVWIKSVPFMESRQPSSRDLKTEPAAQDKSESYLYLGLPQNILPGFDAFASAAVGSEQNPAFEGGIGWDGQGRGARLEGFYTRKELAPRRSQTWFSASPPLPKRDFDIYALGLILYLPQAAFASDWAFSETFAWGQGLYGNFALRLGNKPWRFSLAGDGASGRFADRNGATAGAGFRVAAKGERFWPRSGLLRFQSNIRSPGLEENFERGGFSLYFRPSAPTAAAKRNDPFRIRFTRASLSVNRDARKPEKTADTLNALAGFNFGVFSTVFSCSLHSLSALDGESLFGFPAFENFDSFRVKGELGWKPSRFRFGALDLSSALAYTARAEKDSLWELSLNGSIKPGKWGRVGLKIASQDFPEKWNYTLTWRFEAKLP